MKLVSLYATNFKKLDFNTPLRFSDGITVISGLNEAGKSTILDAILYALYAKVTKPPSPVKNEDLLAYTTGRAMIILEFAIGEKLYKVTREIRRTGTNKATLEERFGEDHWKVIATKSREVTATVISLLDNISFDEMVSSTVVAQKDLDRLEQQGSERWKVINAFLQLESFNEAIVVLNEEKKDLEGTGPSRPGQINTERDKLEQLNRDFREYEKREAQNRTLNEEIGRFRVETASLTARYDELNSLHGQLSKYDEISLLRQKAVDEATAKQKQLDNHRSAVSTYRRQLQGAQNELAKYSGLPPEQDIAKITDSVAKIQAADSKITQLNDSIKAKSGEIGSIQNELRGYDKSAIKKAKASRGSLLPYAGGVAAMFAVAMATFILSISVLPWIATAVGVLLLLVLARNIARMTRLVKLEGLLGKFEVNESKTKELQGEQDELSNQERVRGEAVSALGLALAALTRYSQFALGKEPPERANAILKQFSLDMQNRGSAESSVSKLTSGMGELSGQFDEASMTRQIAELEKTAEGLVLPSLPTGVKFSKGLLAQVTKDREEVGGKISGNNARIAANERTISDNSQFVTENKDIKKVVESQRKLVEQLEHKLKVVKAAKEGIEKTAESRRIRFRPGVESYMGEILPSLTSGRYKAVMLDENFGVQVFDPEAGEYRPKDVFSGGTEDQFLLAMRLAFALALLPEVKGATPQFLWLDEPLGSSDEIRRSGIVEYLNVNLSRLFSQIFIVSHVGGLEEQVNNVVRLENGKF